MWASKPARICSQRVAMRKMAEKAQGARNSEGGIGPLDRGKQQLGGVRLWALTMDEEYMADPVRTGIVTELSLPCWSNPAHHGGDFHRRVDAPRT